MTIQAALARAADLSNWLDSSIHGLDIPSGDREAMAAALFDQVHEHHKAIQLLLKSSLVGSAFSIIRPTLETFVRGVWLLRCASEEEVKRFTKDKMKKGIGELIQDIEARGGYNDGHLSNIKKYAWPAMNSYSHGGYLPAVRRNTEDQIKPNYSEAEKLEVIKFLDAIAALAALEILLMAKREDLAPDLLERMRGT